jgi:FlgD Ig-like domain
MRTMIVLAMALAVWPADAIAQPPSYSPQFLAPVIPSEMNASGDVIGTESMAEGSRAYIVGPDRPFQLLPLPAGMSSSAAIDISDGGVIVGAVGPYSSADYSGKAAAWYPNGAGGFTVELLGQLPGHTISRATAVNDVGDIVGYSSNGTFRYPVLFTAPGGVMDLSSTGVFDPMDINDRRVLVDQSFTAKRLDLNTMIAEDLGVPAPGAGGGGSYRATRGENINEANQVSGTAILTTSTSCDRQAARYTDGIGWEIFSGCGPNNCAYDLNDLGDVMMRLNVDVYVRFEGLGTFRVQDLIDSDVGTWYVILSYGICINNARDMVVFATNPTTDQSGALFLRAQPTGVDASAPPPTVAASLSIEPNPFAAHTTVRFALETPSRADVTIFDATGRRVAVIAVGAYAAGGMAVVWDGRDDDGRPLASGRYVCRLTTPSGAWSERITLLR